jgi:fluoride ion exporter CrcB/FEX
MRGRSFIMLSYIWVNVRGAGAIRTDARFWISGIVGQRSSKGFRDDTLTVNVTGSFMIGLFAALADSERRRANVERNG